MPRLYQYSEYDLNYKPIGAAKIACIVISLMLTTSLLTALTSNFGIDLFGWKVLRADSARYENAALKSDLVAVNRKLEHDESFMNVFGVDGNELREAVGLPPVPPGERKVAIGGVKMNRDYSLPPGENRLVADAAGEMSKLYRQAKLEKQSLSSIRARQKLNRVLFRHIPAIEPIRDGIITSPFGMRFHPILHVMMMHQGIDIGCEVGSHVHATGDGVVSYAGREGGYGNVVEIDNGFGYATLFAHLSKFLVKVGEKVKRGQVIGLSGDTGLSTGPHLHYGVMKNGVFVNPQLYYFAGREFSSRKLYSELTAK